MKKNKLLTCAIIILTIPLLLFIYINITTNINLYINEKVIITFNKTFSEQTLEIADNYSNPLPKIEIEGTDYVGVINIVKENLLLPVESKCSEALLNIKSACHYSNDNLIILGTTLKDSFFSYREYNKDDKITFTNTLGKTYQYKINKIKRINNLNKLSQYNSDLIIVIKNYYDMEYILLLGNAY